MLRQVHSVTNQVFFSSTLRLSQADVRLLYLVGEYVGNVDIHALDTTLACLLTAPLNWADDTHPHCRIRCPAKAGAAEPL